MPEQEEDICLMLKLGNEAGGLLDVRRIEARPASSSVRQSFSRARDLGFVTDTGRITPAGYRLLGAWLNEVSDV